MAKKHRHLCPICFNDEVCYMGCSLNRDGNWDLVGHTTPCRDCRTLSPGDDAALRQDEDDAKKAYEDSFPLTPLPDFDFGTGDQT